MGKDLNWRRIWQPIPVFLPVKAQGQRSLVGCSEGSPSRTRLTKQAGKDLNRHFKEDTLNDK